MRSLVIPHVDTAKYVTTHDAAKKENGFLVELFKSHDDTKTDVYLTCCRPGAFKGYHYHNIRAARYVCIKGIVKVILYVEGKRKEYILSARNRKRLYIPP